MLCMGVACLTSVVLDHRVAQKVDLSACIAGVERGRGLGRKEKGTEGDCILPLPLFASATQAIDLWARLVYDSCNGGLFTCC